MRGISSSKRSQQIEVINFRRVGVVRSGEPWSILLELLDCSWQREARCSQMHSSFSVSTLSKIECRDLDHTSLIESPQAAAMNSNANTPKLLASRADDRMHPPPCLAHLYMQITSARVGTSPVASANGYSLSAAKRVPTLRVESHCCLNRRLLHLRPLPRPKPHLSAFFNRRDHQVAPRPQHEAVPCQDGHVSPPILRFLPYLHHHCFPFRRRLVSEPLRD